MGSGSGVVRGGSARQRPAWSGRGSTTDVEATRYWLGVNPSVLAAPLAYTPGSVQLTSRYH